MLQEQCMLQWRLIGCCVVVAVKVGGGGLQSGSRCARPPRPLCANKWLNAAAHVAVLLRAMRLRVGAGEGLLLPFLYSHMSRSTFLWSDRLMTIEV